jgi:hypothetical protein
VGTLTHTLAWRRASAVVLTGAIAAATLITSAPAPTRAAPPESTSDHIGLFAPDWKTIKRTDTAWDEAARTHEMVIGDARVYAPRIDRLREVNPAITVLGYNIGPYMVEGTTPYVNALAEHPEWFARSASGELIHVNSYPKSVLMDPGYPGWRAKHASIVANLFAKYPGLDGVFVDSVGPSPLRGYTDAPPVNPATGEVYTAQEWLSASVLALNQIKAKVKTKYVMWNGLLSGQLYQEDTRILATSNADGGMSEQFVREPRGSVDGYPSLADWKANLDMVVDMQARGKDVFCWTKVWTTATDDQRKAWNRFALATYLLGKDDRAWYAFSPDVSADRATVWYAQQQAKLGAPLGPYVELRNSVFRRDFEHGIVTVKPAERTAHIVVQPNVDR